MIPAPKVFHIISLMLALKCILIDMCVIQNLDVSSKVLNTGFETMAELISSWNHKDRTV